MRDVMNWRRILRIVKKEFIQIRRDPRLLQIVLVAPVLQLLLFGYAVTTDVTHINTAVYDEDRTQASRKLTEAFVRSGYFDFNHVVSHPDEVARLLDAGKAQMVLRIPRHFAEDLKRNRTAPVQVILDGSDSMTAGIIAGYVGGVVQQYSTNVTIERMERMKSTIAHVPGVESRLRIWYNPELKSVNFMVPGVLCMILLIVTMMLTSLAIVKEREIGTLEQLIVTPIRSRELMLGKTIPFVLIGFIDMVLVLAVSVWWFRVPIAGHVGLLFALTALFLLTCLGVGLLISTISRTQQEAMMTSFFVMLPSMLLSGFMFPIENMPRVIQWVTYAIPLRYFLVIIRGIFLKGSGLEVLWPQVLALAAFGVGLMALSALRFSKNLG
jgi:ABC-2 type transport system permease protein